MPSSAASTALTLRVAATRKLGEREEEIILRLALAVEYRDNDTGEHTLRVARYSRIIAEQLGLPARLCRDIYLAAPLHDVGTVAIPDNILLKPGRLTDEEMAVIRTHATIGERILADSSCELIQLGAQIAAGYHERWDEVVEIAAGQQATPYQTEAILLPIIECAAESRPAIPAA
ncbi:response regulator RpfG family c-di-GMP phosphodiesterase [Bradyrhizobium sp. USDA 4486]